MNKSKERLRAEAEICLNCPLPKCEEDKGTTPNICKRFKAELAKLEAAYKKGKKKNEADK